MIKIFDPMKYELPKPISDEIYSILNSNIEKYFLTELTCGGYSRTVDGFFRVYKNRISMQHIEYVGKKIFEINEILKKNADDAVVIRIDYFLDSGLMIGVYILKDEGEMIGCIKGYRADQMTKDEFIKIWGTS